MHLLQDLLLDRESESTYHTARLPQDGRRMNFLEIPCLAL